MLSRRALVPACALLLAGLAAAGLPSQAASPVSERLTRALVGPDGGTFPGAQVALGDADRRGPALPPLAAARAGLARMGSGLQVSWTQYGTPLSLTRDHGYLATGLRGTPSQVARGYLRQHAALWGLSAADVDALVPVVAEPLSQGGPGWSVSFQQQLAGIPLSQDGYVVIGVTGDKVALVTSSLVPADLLRPLPRRTPVVSIERAVLAAARDAGVAGLSLPDVRAGRKVDTAGFRLLAVQGLHQPQRARVRVLPTTAHGARLVWEVDVLDVAGAEALATMSYVDATTGDVLLRRDAVDTLAEGTGGLTGMRAIMGAAPVDTPGSFQGAFSHQACSAPTRLALAAGDRTLAIAVAAVLPANDIVITVKRNGVKLADIDTLSSPEAGTVSFTPALTAKDKVTAEVCPFDGTVQAPYDFVGGYVGSDVDSTPPSAPPLPGPVLGGTETGFATWRGFGSNPQLARTGVASRDDRYRACSGAPGQSNPFGKDARGCAWLYSDGSRLAYDVNPVTGLPSFTTLGNNAITSNAQASSSLTPGAPFLPPGSPTRDYAPAFEDAWHSNLCSPLSLLPPQRADIDAAVVNLFLGHNRVHDFAYRLGLTETRGALQVSNFGKTGRDVAEGDPELGNAQNAALSHDAFAVTNQATGPAAGVGLTGRNNANQITLQDGVPGITNQYLFQPVVGFSGPCADGDLDGAVFLHEYTHAISNRLIAGPATGLSGKQGGSMGESWSDLTALEYLNAFGLAGSRGEDPYAMGAYVTGNRFRGIRDFNAAPQNNPLNYSDMGFDTTGPEVHADGEIWNAVQMEVRQALVAKYDRAYPSRDKALQAACASGRTAAGKPGPRWDHCPGNRRYITYQYDAMALQANGSPSMVDMKNVELAAVMMRDPRDYDTVADAFARRGLGAGASSKGSDDTDPTPSFASPLRSHNGTVRFALTDATTGKPVKGSVFVGAFSARCTPVATTLGGKNPGSTTSLAAGRYQLTVQAKGYGIQRFTLPVTAGRFAVQTLRLQQNVASGAFGAAVVGNTGALRLGRLLDDTEATNGAFDGQRVSGRTVTVSFRQGLVTFDKVALSALHHPAETLPEGGTEIEGRLTGLHDFVLQVSRDGGRTFTTFYRSPSRFFPTTRPRAVAPDLLLRTITLPHAVTGDAIRLVVLSNTCTGTPEFSHEQENDPKSASDCRSTATNTTQVTIAELEVFRAR